MLAPLPRDALTRPLARSADTGLRHNDAPTAVPRPPARVLTRWALPAAILLTALGLLISASRHVLGPVPTVTTSQVVLSGQFRSMPSDPEVVGESGQAALTPGESEAFLQASGWIEPSPYAVLVPALTEGVIREVLVKEGDTVEAAQVIARLIDDDAVLALRHARAEVSGRRADHAAAGAEAAAAQATITAEQADADELLDQVERKRGPAATGIVSAGEFRSLELRLGGQRARVEASIAAYRRAIAAEAGAAAALEAAEARLAEAQLRLSRMEIRAPAGGVVLARFVEPGSRITLDDTSMTPRDDEPPVIGAVARLYDPASLQARVDVPLAACAEVRQGLLVELTSETEPGRIYRGVVSAVVHEANIQRNTVQFKVRIDDPGTALKPEMLVRARFIKPAPASDAPPGVASTGEVSPGAAVGGLFALRAALTDLDGATAAVWIVDPENARPAGFARARRRAVRLAEPNSEPPPGYAAIAGGLKPGDRIIVPPPSGIRDGALVRVIGEHATSEEVHP